MANVDTLGTKPKNPSIFFRERRLELDDFPGAFAMESHTGGCGLLFTGLWLGTLHFFGPPSLQINLLYIAAGLVMLAFALLLWLSASCTSSTVAAIRELEKHEKDYPDADWTEDREKAELAARKRIALLSALYVVVCCALIYLTGGATSPFAAFYIMIFALTIARSAVPYPGFVVLGYYTVCIVIACASSFFLPWPFTPDDLKSLHDSGFQSTMHALFIVLSLLVPTGSAFLVKLQADAERKLEAKRKAVIPVTT